MKFVLHSLHNNIDGHQVSAPDQKTKMAQILHEILLSMFKAIAATFTNNLAFGLNRKDSHERA